MNAPVRFRIGREYRWGEILNLSSGGALFTCDRRVALAAPVELHIGWPVLLNESVHLSLIARGRIVRAEPGTAAIKFDRHEFRTCSSLFLLQALAPAGPSLVASQP